MESTKLLTISMNVLKAILPIYREALLQLKKAESENILIEEFLEAANDMLADLEILEDRVANTSEEQ